MKNNSRFKTVLITVTIILLMYGSLIAQGMFIQHPIDNSFNGACSVSAYDLDGDGDLDVLAAGNSGNQIAWWRAERDTAITFSKFVIEAAATGIIYVDAVDIDGDNDLDVLGASWQGNEVALWKNLGGDPISWEKVLIDDNITQAHEVHGAYVDVDTLIDIIVASGGDHRIQWYRNTGGNPIVWEKKIVDNQFNGARSVASFDINGDGYNDLIGAALNANQISIWFNSGTNPVQWTKQIVDNTIGGAHWVHIVDLDKDNDADIVAAGAIPGVIAWWRNDGGNPIQWTRQIISNSFAGALSVAAADLDLDDDIDVFSAATNANKISWWENDGYLPIQWIKHDLISNYYEAWPVFGIDFDNDGDTDILTAAATSRKITLLENTTITGIEENHDRVIPDIISLFQNYPNPFNPDTRISFQISETGFITLKVFDILGNELATLLSEEKSAGRYELNYNGSGLPSGIYFYRLTTGNIIITKKMMLIK